jgi:beta-mannosidase
MPWFSTFAKVSEKEDWHPLSPFLIRRNHHRFGQEEILAQMAMHYTLPFDATRSAISERQFADFCILSQSVQSICVRAQTEHYRRMAGQSDVECLGALYWCDS